MVCYSNKLEIITGNARKIYEIAEDIEYAEFDMKSENILVCKRDEIYIIQNEIVTKFDKPGVKKAIYVPTLPDSLYLMYEDKISFFDISEKKEVGNSLENLKVSIIFTDIFMPNYIFNYSNGEIKLYELTGEISRDNFEFFHIWDSGFIDQNPLLVLSSKLSLTSHTRNFIILLSDLSLRYYSLDFSSPNPSFTLSAIDYLSLPCGESVLIDYNYEKTLANALGPYLILFSLKTHKQIKKILIKGQLSHITGASHKLYAQCQLKNEFVLLEINLTKSEITKIKDLDRPITGLRIDSSGVYLAILLDHRNLELLSLVHSNYENTEIYSYDLEIAEE